MLRAALRLASRPRHRPRPPRLRRGQRGVAAGDREERRPSRTARGGLAVLRGADAMSVAAALGRAPVARSRDQCGTSTCTSHSAAPGCDYCDFASEAVGDEPDGRVLDRYVGLRGRRVGARAGGARRAPPRDALSRRRDAEPARAAAARAPARAGAAAPDAPRRGHRRGQPRGRRRVVRRLGGRRRRAYLAGRAELLARAAGRAGPACAGRAGARLWRAA